MSLAKSTVEISQTIFYGTKDSQKVRSSSKPKQGILVRKSKLPTIYLVIDDDGEDRTPKPLNSELYEGTKEKQLGTTSIDNDSDASKSLSQALNIQSKFKSEMKQPDFEEASFLKSVAPFGDTETLRSELDEVFRESFFDGGERRTGVQHVSIPTHISLTLKETSTFFVLDLPSTTELKDTEEGASVVQENDLYEYLTVGKGRNRRTISVGVQTLPVMMKMRNTECAQLKLKDNIAFASTWEMYDTYMESEEEKEEEEEEEIDDVLPQRDHVSVDSYRMATDEKQMLKLVKNLKFQEALCIIERLLANNCYNEQQKIFRGLIEKEYYSKEQINYRYKLKLLWTFSNEDTQKKAVTCMEWNPMNSDILAVGYGKFYVTDRVDGRVLIWNIKNPVQPERRYEFLIPVTSISFSRMNPNILAVGFYSGLIMLINITRRDIHIVAETHTFDTPSIDAVRQVKFLDKKSSTNTDNEDEFIATFDDGKVVLFKTTNTKFLKFQQIMRIPRSDGKLKGLETLRRCASINIPVCRYSAALVFCQKPMDPTIYYVGSDDGVVHTCSTNYLNQHLDLFLAHDGPINHMTFSPFCNKLFVTCGTDMYTRFWVEGISDAILQASLNLEPVTRVVFSPLHSTIIAGIRSNHIYLWDLQRKGFKPQSENVSPQNACNTFIEFTANGNCLVVGDVNGNVHVFALEDMPYPPFFQENMLLTSIKEVMLFRNEAFEKIIQGVRQTVHF